MDEEFAKMRRYMLHHRIVTYAMILFMVLLTFILVSVSRQVQDEQALLLDSQASVSTQGQSCTLGRPSRTIYNGINSCYFGQYRSVSVRCNEGDIPKIIDASSIGQGNVCANRSALEAAAYAHCGCTSGGGGNVPPTVVPTRVVQITPVDAIPITAMVTCKKGINGFSTGDLCPSDDNLYLNATYTCHGGKRGTLGNKVNCYDSTQLYAFAKAACAKESSCRFRPITSPAPTTQVPPKTKATPTTIVFPTLDPR